MITCKSCGKSFATNVYPLYCFCGAVTRSASEDGQPSTHWAALHLYPLQCATWSPAAARAYADAWVADIPRHVRSLNCSCVEDFARVNTAEPFVFDTAAEFFASTVRIHNRVTQRIRNDRHAMPTVPGALAIWQQSLVAEHLAEPPTVDVVVPFHAGDSHLVADCVRALLEQVDALPIVHLVADACDFPALPDAPQIIRYRTPEPWGPYRIANAISHNARSPWFAIQDADDIPLPNRLAAQVATLQAADFEMISNAMLMRLAANQMDPFVLDRASRENETILAPGKRWQSTPRGACVNSLRTMRVDTFRILNGFADWFCSADWDLDNRAAFASVRVLHSQPVLGTRRLHENSLTHAPKYRMGTPHRSAYDRQVRERLAMMKAAPNFATAARLGDLQTAPFLAPIGQK
jgi:hypothetical protein